MAFLSESSIHSSHVWAVRLKHVLVALFVYLLLIFFLSNLDNTEDFTRLLQLNFTELNYANFLIPNAIFYLFFEEFAFRCSLKESTATLIMACVLLLIVSVYTFSAGSLAFYTVSIYGLFLLIQSSTRSPSKISNLTNSLLSILALSQFHLLKFDLTALSFNEQFYNYLLPITVLAVLLRVIRHKCDILASVLTYLLLYLLICSL